MENRYRIVQRTTDYSIFKTLKGNRDVGRPRVRKIINSIEKVGYIMNPIIVNERMEVIDGQGRLEALKELRLPVYYLIVPKAGIAECVSMNINQEQWSALDYIKSYAERGNPEYALLKQAFDEYYPDIPQEAIKAALAGTLRGPTARVIESGEFIVAREDWRSVLNYLNRYVKFRKGFCGSWVSLMKFMLWVYDSKDVDRNVMYDQFKKYWASIARGSAVNTEDVLDSAEKVYNYRRRDKVYLKKCYDEYIRSVCSGGCLKQRKSIRQMNETCL